MKALLTALALTVALIAGLFFSLRAAGDRAPESPPTHALAPGEEQTVYDLRAALAEERARTDRLERELTALRASVERLLDPGRSAALPRPAATTPPPSSVDREAAWYLEQYVRSFDGGGRGSEYFRLAVQAYSLELVDELGQHVKSRAENQLLRTNLAAILGDARLRGDLRALGALFAVLADGEPGPLTVAAAQALRSIAGVDQLDQIVARVFRVPHDVARAELVRLSLDLAGDEPNRVLAALLRNAPDPQAELGLVAQMRTSDLDGALECFELVSYRERPTRLAGAHRTHEFRDPRTVTLVEGWAAREPDEKVRSVLVGAREALLTVPPWAPEQATGAPDVPEPRQDSRQAWASAAASGGAEWLELAYERPMRASEVAVHEVCSAGAVARVVLIDEDGGRHTVWKGVDPLERPDVFRASFPPTAYRVRAVRLELDTARRSGWNEIDAVQLLGPDGAQWASGARASSYYGQGTAKTLETKFVFGR